MWTCRKKMVTPINPNENMWILGGHQLSWLAPEFGSTLARYHAVPMISGVFGSGSLSSVADESGVSGIVARNPSESWRVWTFGMKIVQKLEHDRFVTYSFCDFFSFLPGISYILVFSKRNFSSRNFRRHFRLFARQSKILSSKASWDTWALGNAAAILSATRGAILMVAPDGAPKVEKGVFFWKISCQSEKPCIPDRNIVFKSDQKCEKRSSVT